MLAEIITIGDEFLIGQVVDSNSTWIAEAITSIGIKVRRITSIPDSREEIINALDHASDKADIVFTTGGLGPTKDDITKQTLTEYFNSKLVKDQEAMKRIIKFLSARSVELNELNRNQALLPDNCLVIPNRFGTASGMWFERKGISFISMPGVPYEMKGMMTEFILPRLEEKYSLPVILHKTVQIQGIPESHLARMLSSYEEQLPENVSLAYLPSPGLLKLRLTAMGMVREEVVKLLERESLKLIAFIPPDNLFGMEDVKPEVLIGKILAEKRATVSTAESCTGGTIAQMITSVPGSSRYFTGSIVAYSNEIKVNILGVDPVSIKQYGAVSEIVVRQMAEKVQALYHTTYAIATSGIAGPEGGTTEKPLGTTWIAVASESGTIAEKYNFGDERNRNIRKASITALNMLRKLILAEK